MEYKQRVQYDINWFLQFYNSKDESLWITGKLVEQCKETNKLKYDVIGWLHRNDSSWDLFKRKILFNLAPNIVSVNDNKIAKYNQSTAKQRVIAYLEDIKKQKDANKLYWDKQRELENLN